MFMDDEEIFEFFNTLNSDVSSGSSTESDDCSSADEDEGHQPEMQNSFLTQTSAIPLEWTEEKSILQSFAFMGSKGVQVQFPPTVTPINVFNYFFDEEIIHIITEETNKYGELIISNENLKVSSRMKTWKPTTATEVRNFFGLVILMSIIKKPTIAMYFSKDQLLGTPFFSEVMSRNRFQSLLTCLHFSSEVTACRLQKLGRILSILTEKFKTAYLPNQNICVDESLMLWKGRLGFRQYIPSKRSRYGIKSYELCDSDNGYVWNFVIYTGKDTKIQQGPEPYGERVVLTLLDSLKGKGHVIYTDRFFTSPMLAVSLMKHKTAICGTVQKNRKLMPRDFPPQNLVTGEIVVRQRGNLKAVAWADKKVVLMLTSIHEATSTNSRKIDRTSGEPKKKPLCVLKYNENMGGVDMCDGVIQNYHCIRKTIKWYKKVFFHMMDIAIFNSLVVYKCLGKQVTLLQFRRDLAESLISDISVSSDIGRKSPHDHPLRLTEKHFPTTLPATSSSKRPRRSCKVCYNTSINDSKRVTTHFMCSKCNVALCLEPCFESYHTLLHY